MIIAFGLQISGLRFQIENDPAGNGFHSAI